MGSCNSTTNCNPCGPDYNAINQLATQTAAYARQANTYSVEAQNAWLEFNALYLGAFAVAPTVDNEGDPLQVGALYWNSVSNELFAWNGTIWVATNFNELTPFLATGSTTARNLVTRTADVVNVKDFGAVGDGVADDTAAIQAAEAFAFTNNKPLFFPAGTYLQNGSRQFRCSIIGYGATIKNTIGSEQITSSPVIHINGTSGLFIRGITVDANNWSTGFQADNANRVTYQDCIAKNCLNAGFNSYYCNECSYINCQSIGVKYNAIGLIQADGFYLGACQDISYVNCIAENFQRIGFVSEGESSNDSYRTRYVSCLAKNGNNCDRSPTEFNAGFWMENTNGAVIDDCTVVDIAGNAGQTSGRIKGIVIAGGGDSEDNLAVLSNTTIGDSTGTIPVAISVAGSANKATVIVNNARIKNYNTGIAITSGVDNVIIENVTLVDGKYLSGSHGGIVFDGTFVYLINKISCSDVKELDATYSVADAATFNIFTGASSGNREIYLNKFIGSVAMRQAFNSLIVSDSTITCRSTSYNILFGLTLLVSNTNFIQSGGYRVFTSSDATAKQQITNCQFSGFIGGSSGGLVTLAVAELIINNCLFYDSQFHWNITNNDPTLKMSNCLFRMSGATPCIRTNFYNAIKDTAIIQNCTFYTTATNAIELWNFTPDYLILQGNTYSSTNLTNMIPTSNVNNVATP